MQQLRALVDASHVLRDQQVVPQLPLLQRHSGASNTLYARVRREAQQRKLQVCPGVGPCLAGCCSTATPWVRGLRAVIHSVCRAQLTSHTHANTHTHTHTNTHTHTSMC
jgi:hypothetical protein